MDNFRVIYRILRYFEQAMDYDEPDLDMISAKGVGISENRWLAIMEILVKEGYLDGISIKRSLIGDVAITQTHPRITLAGLSYLNENSVMKKAAKTAKGIAEIVGEIV